MLARTFEAPGGAGDDWTSCAYDVAGLSAYTEERGIAEIEEHWRLYQDGGF